MMDATDAAALTRLGVREEWPVAELPDDLDADILRCLDQLELVEVAKVTLVRRRKNRDQPPQPTESVGRWFSPMHSPDATPGWDEIRSAPALDTELPEGGGVTIKEVKRKRYSPMFPERTHRIVSVGSRRLVQTFHVRLTERGKAELSRLGRRDSSAESPEQSVMHCGMSPEDLITAFGELNDPQTRIDRTQIGSDVVVRLVPSWAKPAAAKRFQALAVDAAGLFDLAGNGDPVEQWMRYVLDHAPELVENRDVGIPKTPGFVYSSDDGKNRERKIYRAHTLFDPASASILVIQRRKSHVGKAGMIKPMPDSTAPPPPPAAASMPTSPSAPTSPMPVRKPDGWTRSELITQAKDIAGRCGDTTFDTIRKAAGVTPSERGGRGQQRRYSRAELRMIIKAVEAGRFLGKTEIADAWRQLLDQ